MEKKIDDRLQSNNSFEQRIQKQITLISYQTKFSGTDINLFTKNLQVKRKKIMRGLYLAKSFEQSIQKQITSSIVSVTKYTKMFRKTYVMLHEHS